MKEGGTGGGVDARGQPEGQREEGGRDTEGEGDRERGTIVGQLLILSRAGAPTVL